MDDNLFYDRDDRDEYMKMKTKAASSRTYNDLLMMLDKDEATKEDTYKELMAHESKVLRSISSASNHRQKNEQFTNLFLNTSISDIIARFAFTWQNIFHELVIERQFDSIPMILFKQERKLHVGLMMVFISGFLFLATV